MSTTKTYRTYIAEATSIAAGTPQVGNILDHRTANGGLITAKITNGVTGPTVPATVTVYTSGDGVKFKYFNSATAGIVGSTAYEFNFRIPKDVMYSRTDIGGNTAQSVTGEAFMQETSSN